jgi:two-component system, chemotaxis family, sensor kinase CheA
MNRDELSARLLATFITELEDQVGALNEGLLALERDPSDADALRLVFRVAHTIKGAARVSDLPLLEELCHALESFFAGVREGRLALAPPCFPLLFEVADALGDAGRELRQRGAVPEESLAGLIDRLHEEAAGAGGEPAEPAEPAAPPERRPAAPRPAPGPPPDPETPAPEPQRSAPPEPAASTERSEEWVRVQADKLDRLLSVTTELVLAAGRISARRRQWDFLGDRLAEAPEEGSASEGLARRAAQLAEAMDHEVQGLERVTGELGAAVRRLRLRPLGDMWEALPRAVRDTASASGKRARLELVGGEVEADRVVIDALREPLLHLVRNAVDHGIEPPEARRAAGKPEEGTVRVGAAMEQDRLVVRVEDDGAGLDAGAIRRALADRGRPVPARDEELVRALLAGGLSTAGRATAISGRGVGLDIVRSALEEIGGSLDVEWTPGRGTTFVLEAPPSPTSIRALLVGISSQIFALPTGSVDRLLRVHPDSVARAEGRPVLTGSGAPIPLHSLAGVLGAPLQPRPLAEPMPAVLLRAGSRRAAMLVDDLISEEEIIVRPIRRTRGAAPHVSGGALLPSGRIALVLAASSLLDAALGRDRTEVEVRRHEPEERKRVLVADDSITTRTLEQSVLEAAGYRVVTAVDGLDAWQRLQDQPFDAVVADVEMPRMDGLTLCERIRASGRFRELPVVLVTGLETPADRARGMEAGADAYLTKSGFDQSDLLGTLQQLVG